MAQVNGNNAGSVFTNAPLTVRCMGRLQRSGRSRRAVAGRLVGCRGDLMIDPLGVSVAGAPVVLATVPPGPASVVITNAGAVTMFVGAGTAATTGSGAPVPASGVVPAWGSSRRRR